jgi:integrase
MKDKVKGITQRSTGLYMWRIKVPKPIQAMLDGRANFYHSLGYDKAKAFALAIKYQEKYTKLFRSIRSSQQNTSLQSGSQLLSDLGIPLRQHTQDEIMNLPIALENILNTVDHLEYEELPPKFKQVADILRGTQEIKLSDVNARYIRERGKTDTNRPVEQFIEVNSDMDIRLIKREHIYSYRTWLIAKGNASGTQIKRISAISRLFNFAKAEYDLPTLGNPATRITFDTSDTKERLPLSNKDYKTLLDLSIAKADDKRTLLAVLAVTGCRLSEVTGLLVGDVDTSQRSITVRPNAYRTIKTSNSNRTIPIVNDAVWSLLLSFTLDKGKEEAVFPDLIGKQKMNSVSAVSVKFIKKNVAPDSDAHSIRHTVTQKLKDVVAPDAVIKALLGWSNEGMLNNYGGELAIDVKRKWLEKALL